MALAIWQLGQRVTQQRRFVTVARGTNKWRDHVAMAIAEGNDLVAFQVLMAAVPQIVASLLRCRGRAVAVNDREVEQLALMKLAHRAGKYLVDKAVGLPAPHRPIDPRVVDFWETFGIPFDRQHLPLAAHVQQLQDVVEDFVQRQRGWWAASTTAQMWQDKFVELLKA
jgi:hypothetical protein